MKTQIASNHGLAALLAMALLTTIASAQNVGIGTTTPRSKLSVNGSTASGGLAIGDATYTSTLGTIAPLNGAIIQGRVGIGITTPGTLLSNFNDNIIGSNNRGANLSSITWHTNSDGYVASLYNSSTAVGSAGGLSVKVASTSVEGNALDISSGTVATDIGSAMLVVKNTGDVGIATPAPQSRLDVRGTTKVLASNGIQTGELWSGTSNVSGFEVFADPATGDSYGAFQREGVNPCLHLAKPAGPPAGSIFVSFLVGGAGVGSITYTGSGTSYNTTSDERLKENIQPSSKGLADVMKIQVSDYNYKASPDRAETGFIAQQLHTVFPNAVTPGGEDPAENPWTVDYGRVTPVLVKATQELAEKVAALEAENAKLKDQLTRLDALAARMDALEEGVAVSAVAPTDDAGGTMVRAD